MAETATEDTRQCARRYFEAWTTGDTATAGAALHPDFQFSAGDMQIDGRDAFLSAGAFPRDAVVTMVAEAYEGGVAFQMYDATLDGRTARIVEQLAVKDGLIVRSTFVTDMASFLALTGR
ncbi:nuclear transport factor 2 family protein [Agromyces sp. SYSU K20354]|uniref:nuclear transport factor 2 family protein n=1 Tax=Agromyces cavernae TaxID=2898659 RepID=UPI001E55D1D8|nr:nuclear transport factor 2 family protein [Agromyces cavernae]MCD2440982.1 nuclear transport factor 2 family protein [Agromyces cavernae]